MVRPLTDGLEYCTVTVEIPTVWETLAAGLGVLGVVIPCAQDNVLYMSTNKIRGRLRVASFFIGKEIKGWKKQENHCPLEQC